MRILPFRTITSCLDLALLGLATITASFLRENLTVAPDKLDSLLPLLGLTLAIAAPVHAVLGTDRQLWRYCTMIDCLRVAVAVVCTVLASTLAVFTINRMDGIARSIPILQAMLAIMFMVGARVATRLWFSSKLQPLPQSAVQVVTPKAQQSCVLVIGMSKLTHLYLAAVSELSAGNVRIAGVLDIDDMHAGRQLHQVPIFGSAEELPDLLNRLSVHGVFVDRLLIAAPDHVLSGKLKGQLKSLQDASHIAVELLASKLGLDATVTRDDQAARETDMEWPVVSPVFDIARLQRAVRRPFWSGKRIIDFALSVVLLILLAPLVAGVWLVVVSRLGQPTLFWQDRPGYRGRLFRLYKFRTMGGAFDAAGRHRPDNERVTGLGLFLRTTRLDELPQLWNIAKGEMSFMGPRPLLPVDQSAAFAARLVVRPGLTGWAQVMGGREVSAADKAALDVWYVQNASLKLDIEIAFRTVQMLVFGERVSQAAIDRAWADLRTSGIAAPSATPGAASQLPGRVAGPTLEGSPAA